MPRFLRFALCGLVLFVSPAAFAQTTSTSTVATDPRATTLANQAMLALIGTTAVSDITLTGTATRVAGSDVGSGSVTMKALGTGESKLDLDLSNGTRSEVRNLLTGPGGSWVGPDGVAHGLVSHNCLTDAAWFFPALSALSQASSPNVLATYVGQETRSGVAVQHLRFMTQVASAAADPSGLVQSLSSEDIYLAASSSLPVALVFYTHPDNNANVNIPVEIDFSNYQSVSGAQIPFRIQKFLNGSLLLDITIQSAALNSGLTDSVFLSD